jgi:CHAD domain-containing protein
MAIKTKADLSRAVQNSWINKHNYALKTLASDQDPHTKIHEIRKTFKQIRGLLRLIRYTDLKYKNHNRFYRDQARQVSYLRDSTSFIETMGGLYRQYESTIDSTSYQLMMEYLFQFRSDLLNSESETFERIHENLTEYQEKIHGIEDFDLVSFSQLERGLSKTYRKAQKRYQLCVDDKYDENYHDLRKRIKYLRYQLQQLQFLRYGYLKAFEKELSLVSDLLGMDHDLENFADFLLVNERKIGVKSQSMKPIYAAISQHRIQMKEHVIIQGRKVLSLDEVSYAKLFKNAWKAYRKSIKAGVFPLSELIY